MTKKIPYALQNFKEIRENDYLYIDKTKYIEILERMENYVLYLRPRRFGKTLFTSMLTYYYDEVYKDEFESLFSNLYIGKNKTKKASQYQVLTFNFSGISTNKDKIESDFAYCIRSYIQDFITDHKLNICLDRELKESNQIIRNFFTNYKEVSNKKIFLIIDEYDHFANDILSGNKAYFDLMNGKDGFVRKFYEVLKFYTGNIIERIFITGVTPIAIDSLTSGFNITSNLGHDRILNEMIGFSEEEVKHLLKECEIDENVIAILKENYNGYRFHVNAENKVYNSNLFMYFLKEYQKEKKIPANMIDKNVSSDYTKIIKLFDLYENVADKQQIILDILDEQPILSLIDEQMSEFTTMNRQSFISLLYYLGLLTLDSELDVAKCLKVPNNCIKSIYSKYYLNYLEQMVGSPICDERLFKAIWDITNYNNFTNFIQIVEGILHKLANVDYQRFDEKYVKVILFSLLSMSNQYTLKSEYEIEGYRADLIILPNFRKQLNCYFMIELKYLSKESASKSNIVQKKEDAIKQIRLYGDCEEIKQMKNLKKYIMIVVKDKIKIFEEVH